VSGQQHAPAALYPRERSGIHCTGGWVGPRAGLDGRKISSPPGFDPGPSSPQISDFYGNKNVRKEGRIRDLFEVHFVAEERGLKATKILSHKPSWLGT